MRAELVATTSRDPTTSSTSSGTDGPRPPSQCAVRAEVLAVAALAALSTAFHLGFQFVLLNNDSLPALLHAPLPNTTRSLLYARFLSPQSPLLPHLCAVLAAVLVVLGAGERFAGRSYKEVLVWSQACTGLGLLWLLLALGTGWAWARLVGLCTVTPCLVVGVALQVVLVQDMVRGRQRKVMGLLTGVAFALGTCCGALACVAISSSRVQGLAYLANFLLVVPCVCVLQRVPEPLFHHIERAAAAVDFERLNEGVCPNADFQRSFDFYFGSRLDRVDAKDLFTRASARCSASEVHSAWRDQHARQILFMTVVLSAFGCLVDHRLAPIWYVFRAATDADAARVQVFAMSCTYLFGAAVSVPFAQLVTRRSLFMMGFLAIAVCEAMFGLSLFSISEEKLEDFTDFRFAFCFRILQAFAAALSVSTHAWSMGAELSPRNLQLLATGLGLCTRFLMGEVFAALDALFPCTDAFVAAPFTVSALLLGLCAIVCHLPSGTEFAATYSWWIEMDGNEEPLNYFKTHVNELHTTYHFERDYLKRLKHEHLTKVEDMMGVVIIQPK